MALGSSKMAFLPAQEGAQGSVGAVQRVGRQTQSFGCPVDCIARFFYVGV